MDAHEMGLRLELLRLAKEIVEVNSIGNKEPGGELRLTRQPAYPSYSVDQVLLTARRLYEFVTGDEGAEKKVEA